MLANITTLANIDDSKRRIPAASPSPGTSQHWSSPSTVKVQHALSQVQTKGRHASTTTADQRQPSGSSYLGITVVPNTTQHESVQLAPQPSRQGSPYETMYPNHGSCAAVPSTSSHHQRSSRCDQWQSHQDSDNHAQGWQGNLPALAITPVKDHGIGIMSHAGRQADQTLEDLAVKESLSPLVESATMLSPILRSTTSLSGTSSNGRVRQVHRLSYLAHLETLKAEEEVEEEEGETNMDTTFPQVGSSPAGSTTTAPNWHNHTPREILFVGGPNGPHLPPASAYDRSHMYKTRVIASTHSPSVVPIASMYRRLLGVFRPPTESSESDSSGCTEPSESRHQQRRGPRTAFGLPSSTLENSGRGNRSIAKSDEHIISSPRSSTTTMSPLHKPPESMGFRARLLKKLTSSPNLSSMLNNPTSVAPETPSVASSFPVPSQDLHFEHESSCPAGHRVHAGPNIQGRPRASTLPGSQGQMPTLQSKYGVPGRELGAGSQAQVMLLRVKSSTKEKWEQQQRQQQQQRMSSSKNGIVVDAPQDNQLLSPPHFGSSTLITTTEDEVTPQQREAYRKQLLHRTSSTGGLSTTENGGLIYAIKKFRPPKATETHRRYLKKVCAEFCISTSMDHENIIRTIDLVRDQPEQEWAEDDFDADHHHQGNMRTDRKHDGVDGGGDDARPYHECNCLQEYRRRVRVTAKNVDEPQPSIVSMAHWKQSKDTLPSNRHSHFVHRSHYQNQAEPTSYHHHYHDQSKSHLAAHAKTKQQQQLEQELRQKEVQRLKHQKQREKRLAERWRQEQFPEYCMVMEYAAGGDLFNVLTKSYPPITLKEKHCLWRQLISGVQYMHSIGVAHRDLKPENLLLDGTGRILKITDFGIANVFKSVGDPVPLPCSGVIGSEPYIAPEEFYQEEYDPRAVDVWACGIIFYVMYYSAMPWARADRKRDARFARYVNDIVTHRQAEPQRRLRYERRQLQYGRSSSSLPDHHRHNDCGCPGSSGLRSKAHSLDCTSTVKSGSTATYYTYAYNNYIGGHGFIDRIETPGSRRVLYGILEPDARRRLTIDQVANDEWVSRIRFCTDCPMKQEQQAVMIYGKDAAMTPQKYLQLPNGELHHRHSIPKTTNWTS